ncbi:MAG TPA: hypothetical protein VF817_04405 [Patescibacteria group bacterium]
MYGIGPPTSINTLIAKNAIISVSSIAHASLLGPGVYVASYQRE